MAERDFPRIGTLEWCKQMQWGWGVYKKSVYVGVPWIAYDCTEDVRHFFATHAEATAYVRSQIAKA